MSGPAISKRYGVLDAWRGICACLVTIVHIPVAHSLQGAVPFQNMQLFVDFFFVLSGFVIMHAYGARIGDSTAAAGFMIRRFGRVWPLHAVVLGGFIGLELMKLALDVVMKLPLDGTPFTGNRSFETLLSNLALTQAFGLHGMTSWNGPAWSIGVEFYTYALFALAVLAAGARASLFAALAALGLAGVLAFSQNWIFTTHDFGFFRCVYGFFLGTLVAMAVAGGRPVVRITTAVEIAAVAILACFIIATGVNASSLLAPPLFALVVYVFAFEQGRISEALQKPWAQALGLWSYSIYMVHMLLFAGLKIVFTFVAKIEAIGLTAPVAAPVKLWSLGSPVLDAGLVAAELAFVILVARFTYAWIEDPARRAFARIAGRFERGIPPARLRLAVGEQA